MPENAMQIPGCEHQLFVFQQVCVNNGTFIILILLMPFIGIEGVGGEQGGEQGGVPTRMHISPKVHACLN